MIRPYKRSIIPQGRGRNAVPASDSGQESAGKARPDSPTDQSRSPCSSGIVVLAVFLRGEGGSCHRALPKTMRYPFDQGSTDRVTRSGSRPCRAVHRRSRLRRSPPKQNPDRKRAGPAFPAFAARHHSIEQLRMKTARPGNIRNARTRSQSQRNRRPFGTSP